MISQLLYAFESALIYVRQNTSLQFAFVLMVLLPLVLLYTSNQFLQAGRANQDKLQRDRVGMMHDALLLTVASQEREWKLIQEQINGIAQRNPDISELRVLEERAGIFTIRASLQPDAVGQLQDDISLYRAAFAAHGQPVIFPFATNQGRIWQTVTAFSSAGQNYYIFSENSLAAVDANLANREYDAYLTLAIVYILLAGVAFWLIRLTNYRQLFEQAQQAIATKDMFTNMIAHELRAPLTAIKGYASMVGESITPSDETYQYTERIQKSADHLLSIITDLLDVARIQSGRLTLNRLSCNVRLVVEEVTQELQPLTTAKSLKLQASGPEVNVHTDRQRLHQILTNLVSNAIKYTKEGTIEIEVFERPRDVEIRVKDTGMGISAEDREQLFAPFFRVDSKDMSKISGTGLGMWITRQFVELLGGRIGVESIKNIGTHVVISFPKK